MTRAGLIMTQNDEPDTMAAGELEGSKTRWFRIHGTPVKTNMFPENQWLEDVFPTEIFPILGDKNAFEAKQVLPAKGSRWLSWKWQKPGV